MRTRIRFCSENTELIHRFTVVHPKNIRKLSIMSRIQSTYWDLNLFFWSLLILFTFHFKFRYSYMLCISSWIIKMRQKALKCPWDCCWSSLTPELHTKFMMKSQSTQKTTNFPEKCLIKFMYFLSQLRNYQKKIHFRMGKSVVFLYFNLKFMINFCCEFE